MRVLFKHGVLCVLRAGDEDIMYAAALRKPHMVMDFLSSTVPSLWEPPDGVATAC